MTRGLLLVGRGELFLAAAAQFRQRHPGRRLELCELDAGAAEEPDPGLFDGRDPGEWSVFAAIGMEGMNFQRLGIFSLAKQHGFTSESLVHPSAVVDPSATLGQNCYVGELAVLGPGARLDYNACLGARSVVGGGAHIAHSAWIGAQCTLGTRCKVGAHSVLDAGVALSDGVSVGRYCELQIARRYDGDVPDKTYHHALFERPVHIYG